MKFEFLVQIFLLAHLRTSLLYPSEALHIVSFAKLKKPIQILYQNIIILLNLA